MKETQRPKRDSYLLRRGDRHLLNKFLCAKERSCGGVRKGYKKHVTPYSPLIPWSARRRTCKVRAVKNAIVY